MTSETLFTLQLPAGIQFGRGAAAGAADVIVARGRQVLLVHGGDAARAAWLQRGLAHAGARVTTLACPREPDVTLVEAGVALGREVAAEVVVGLGGGAVLDLAKAVAGLVPASGEVLDYLEVVGRGRALDAQPLPWVALPSTAGTGAEVTANAVIGVPAKARKVSLRDTRLLADIAIVDPALTDSSPRAVTLASGLDAITQVIEPYISGFANRFTDLLCRDAIPRGLAALPALMRAESTGARDEMAWVSLCGGLALANAKLGAVHGLAGPLGGIAQGAHGAIAGCLLPPVLDANREACDGQAAARIAEVDRWITDAFGVAPEQATAALQQWSREQGLPGLGDMAVPRGKLPAIARAARGSSSMKGNPVALDEATLVGVMERAW